MSDQAIVDAVQQLAKKDQASLGVKINEMFRGKPKEKQRLFSDLRTLCDTTGKTKKTGKIVISDQDTFQVEIKKMKAALARYHSPSNAEKDDNVLQGVSNLKIHFGKDFTACSDAELKEIHTAFEVANSSLKKVDNFLCFERGRLYSAVRAKKARSWMNFCGEALKATSRTVNRYIGFYCLCITYPGLLVCGLSFSGIMNHADRLIKLLQVEQDMKHLLMQPLRKSTLMGKPINVAGMFGGDKPSLDTIARASWKPDWEARDSLEPEEDEGWNEGDDDNEGEEKPTTSAEQMDVDLGATGAKQKME